MTLPLPLRLAWRELRGGLSGLRLLAVCLFLGVAALAGVGSLSAAILGGLASKGQAILGGDAEVRIALRPATPAERTAFARAGSVSEMVTARAMAGRGGDRVLVELKAVDSAYPLYGAVAMAGGGTFGPALEGGGAVIAPALAERLRLKVGDAIEVGAARLRVGGIIADEPDRAGGGFGFGPTLIVSTTTLPATRIVQPGGLITWHYRLKLAPADDPARTLDQLKARFPGAGWEVRDRSNGAPGLRRFVIQLGQFLTLIGLVALIVAGVGVGNGVSGYLASKSGTIATMKGLGASTMTINTSYLLQIGLVSIGAVALGALAGGAAPWLVARAAGDALPVAPAAAFYPVPLAVAAAYGLLVALAFALVPLARASRASPARLLRAGVEGGASPSRAMVGYAVAAGLALAAIAVARSTEPLFAAAFIAGALALTGLLALIALGVQWLARRAPRPPGPLARLALGGIHRPGSTAPQLIVALGLGLSLFATLAVIETSLSARIAAALPKDAPDLVLIDVPKAEIATLRALVARTAPGARVNAVPSLRGPVTAVRGVPVARLGVIPEGAWVLQGDRGLSYAERPPADNPVVEGRWWPARYEGPPLVSMDVTQAKLLGLRVGDRITVAVLGAEIEATIANFRRLDFTRPALQYMFVYNPSALEGAPHTWVATIALPAGVGDGALRRAAAVALPTVSIVDVKAAVGQVNDLLAQILFAIRAAAGVTIAAGIAVLVGALAAGRRSRTYDAVLLKVLGASRGAIVAVAAIEYGLIAAAVALIALGIGAAAGWAVLAALLSTPFAPAWGPVIATVLGGAALTVALGLAGSWSALSASPNRALRAL